MYVAKKRSLCQEKKIATLLFFPATRLLYLSFPPFYSPLSHFFPSSSSPSVTFLSKQTKVRHQSDPPSYFLVFYVSLFLPFSFLCPQSSLINITYFPSALTLHFSLFL